MRIVKIALLTAAIACVAPATSAEARGCRGGWFPGKLALRSAGAAARVTYRGARGLTRVAILPARATARALGAGRCGHGGCCR